MAVATVVAGEADHAGVGHVLATVAHLGHGWIQQNLRDEARATVQKVRAGVGEVDVGDGKWRRLKHSSDENGVLSDQIERGARGNAEGLTAVRVGGQRAWGGFGAIGI